LKYFLGIDYGTGGAKTCLVNDEMDVISYSFREYEIITRKPGQNMIRITTGI